MILSYNNITPDTEGAAFIAGNASVIGDVVLKKNSSVWFGAVLRGDSNIITVGEESNIQDSCVLHADEEFPLTVGKGVTVGHGAVLHGCTVGDGSLIGMGAVVLNGAVIGKGCMVGAGALLTGGKIFEEGWLILGSPAKAVRPLTPEEAEGLKKAAAHYVRLAEEYKKNTQEGT